LEVPLGADDIPGDLARPYGDINRALPGAELDAFVEALATRIASFDKQPIAETKNFDNIASPPPDAVLPSLLLTTSKPSTSRMER
jgi:hypothetical protein